MFKNFIALITILLFFSQAFASMNDIFSTEEAWQQGIFDDIPEAIDKHPILIRTKTLIVAQKLSEELKNKLTTKNYNIFICNANDNINSLEPGDIIIATNNCTPKTNFSILDTNKRLEKTSCGRVERDRFCRLSQNFPNIYILP